MRFEKTAHFGPLGEFLERCKPHRIESIYNSNHKYIKEIIWDDELNKKYGETREGYEKFKQSEPGNMGISGITDLRVRTDKNGNVIGYMTESKRTKNDDFKAILDIYYEAKAKMYQILKVKDKETFDFWLDSVHTYNLSSCTNSTITSIQSLERIITRYNNEPEFKQFLDKIKG